MRLNSLIARAKSRVALLLVAAIPVFAKRPSNYCVAPLGMISIIVFSEYGEVFSEREAHKTGVATLVSKTEALSVLVEKARAGFMRWRLESRSPLARLQHSFCYQAMSAHYSLDITHTSLARALKSLFAPLSDDRRCGS